MTDRPRVSVAWLLEVMPDAAIAVGPDGVILDANQHAAELFGYAEPGLRGVPVERLIPPRFRTAHPAHRSDYGANPRTRPMSGGLSPLFGHRLDDSEFPAEIMLSTVIEDGSPVVIAAVRDLSERTGQELLARLAAIVESSSDAILAKDRDGIVTEWNAGAERLYGYTREEMVGRPVATIIPPDRQSETANAMELVLAGEALAAFPSVRVAKDGERIDVSIAISPILDANGLVRGASTIARDIRAQLRAEAERSYTHALFAQSIDAIIAIDLDGLITAWSPAAQRMFGYAAREAIGRPLVECVVADDDQEQPSVVAGVLTGRSLIYSARRRARDGRLLELSLALSPIRAADGTITGAVSIVRDISAAAEAETKARDAARREAELLDELHQTRRLESIGRLAGGVAHDFNNLLGVILNYAEFVLEDLPAGAQARADLEEIHGAAERGAALTRQLLIFSRRDEVRPVVFDVNALITELLNLLQRALGERVALHTTLHEDLFHVRADRGQIEQVLVNLAVNGRDAMVDGGDLEVRTGNLTLGADDAALHGDLGAGDYVVLTVTDSGTGMSPEVMERAFEPFFTTKPTGEGTGLGLATVYGIVKEAGGRVSLYSEGGFGSSVKVYLPACAAPAHQPQVAPDVPLAGARVGETILLVEDQDEVRLMTRRILLDAGYVVVAAAGGAHALTLLDAQPIDLLLTDVVMPGMLGPELATRARARDQALKVVFMSGYSDRVLSHDELREQAGAAAFLDKPFSAAALRGKLREVLDAEAAAPTTP